MQIRLLVYKYLKQVHRETFLCLRKSFYYAKKCFRTTLLCWISLSVQVVLKSGDDGLPPPGGGRCSPQNKSCH